MTSPVKTRGARGGGSVSLQKSGLWQARVSCGRDAEGKRVVRVAYGKTKTEANKLKIELLRRHTSGEVEPSKDLLGAYLERWLAHKKGKIADTTYASYEGTINTYINRDLIARMPLGKVSPLAVEELLTRLKSKFAAGEGACTLKMVFVVLKMALKKAAGWGLLSVNPMSDSKVDAPKYKATQRPVWELGQATTFLKAAEGDRLHALYVLALTCGLRHGELLGLQWENVDIERRTLHVCWSLPEVRGHVMPLKAPKTKAGTRDVPLCAMAIEALKKRRAASLEEGTAASTYVFPNQSGNPMSKSAVYRSYEALLTSTGVPRIVLHDQRHTAATLMRAAGLDLKLLSANLGHSQLAVTSDRYAHVLPSEQAVVRDVLKDVWGA